MIGHHILQKVEPEKRDLGQNPALVRDAGGQNIVERGDAIGGNKQQPVVVQPVHVADFAAGVKFELRKVGLQEDGIEEIRAHA